MSGEGRGATKFSKQNSNVPIYRPHNFTRRIQKKSKTFLKILEQLKNNAGDSGKPSKMKTHWFYSVLKLH